jgi:tripartite-type tricarboxylate transporter receptor subunit TctC
MPGVVSKLTFQKKEVVVDRKNKFGQVFVFFAMLLFIGVQAPLDASAAYPERPVEILIKAGPGSGADQLARFVANLFPKYVGENAVVIYKKGGSGSIAQAYVQKRPADGYQLFLDTTTMAIITAQGKVPFTEDDWQAIIRLQVDPEGFAVRADSPWKDLRDLVEWTKKNPGQLRWAGVHPVGIDPYTVGLLSDAAGGLDFKYVPTDGANHQVALLLGKHIDVATLNPQEVKEQAAAGNFRVIGMGHSERMAEFPDWPTFKEQGFDVESHIWRGVFAKAGTPRPIIDKLHDSLNRMRQSSEFKEFMRKSAQLDGYLGGPEKFQAYFSNEVKKMRTFFKK